MKTIIHSFFKAAALTIMLLFAFAPYAMAAVTVTQNQASVTGTALGKGTTNQRILQINITTAASDAAHTVSNVKLTLTGYAQMAKVSVYSVGSNGNFPDIGNNSYFFASVDNPATDIVSLDGTYNIAAGSSTKYLVALIDLKPEAIVTTPINVVCSELTTTASGSPITSITMSSAKTITVAENLTGIKTVKNSDGDYTTLTAAVAAINTLGVGTGGLTIEVADNQTITQTTSTNIIRQTGTATNPIVIKRSGTGTIKPIIVATNNGNSAFDTNIGGMGVDYITIDGLDFRSTDGTGKTETPINFYGYYNRGCNNIEIKNCDINCGTPVGSDFGIKIASNARGTVTGVGAGIYGNTSNSNIKIHHNTITNAYAAIDFNYNSTLVAQDHDIEIYNNTITAGSFATFKEGIKLKYCTDVDIYNNSVDGSGVTSTSSMNGIATDGTTCAGTINCYNNVVKNMAMNANSNNSGISLVANTVNIYNNVVSNLTNSHATSSKVIIGINMGTDNALMPVYNLYHNSVYLNQSVSNTSQLTAAVGNTSNNGITSITMANNIFVNNSVTGTPANNYVVFIQYKDLTKLSAASNNNLYYANDPASTRFKFSNTTYATFDLYKAASIAVSGMENRELNSVSADPLFVDAAGNDLTITNALSLTSNTGTALAAVTTDINGNPRHATKPDLGAYEDAHAPVSTLIADLLNKQHIIYSANGAIVAKINESATVSVIDAKGSVLYKNTVNAQTLSIPVSQKGLYIIRIQNKNENTTNKVLVL